MTHETGGPRQPPCHDHDPEMWFAEAPATLHRAKMVCRGCPLRAACLDGALDRREPWGVWGGEIVINGTVVAHKRGRGRPTNAERLRARQERELDQGPTVRAAG
jgi:WhiB family redox-sensing transcriptional regulator